METLWGQCPQCRKWFLIEDETLDTLRLCPAHLVPADRLRRLRTKSDEDVVPPDEAQRRSG